MNSKTLQCVHSPAAAVECCTDVMSKLLAPASTDVMSEFLAPASTDVMS